MRLALRPVDWAAIGFAATAVAFMGLWAVAHEGNPWVEQWAANLSVEAGSISATILIVDRIVRREEQRHLAPRLEGAYRRLAQPLSDFVDAAEDDLARARPAIRPAPRRLRLTRSSPVLDEWLVRLATEDAERPPPVEDEIPRLASRARRAAEELTAAAERDREVLPPDLVVAIDDLEHGISAMLGGYLVLGDWLGTRNTPIAREMNPLVDVIEKVRAVVTVYRRHADRHWQEAERLRRYGRELRSRRPRRPRRRRHPTAEP
jgi:hypothetical protein